MAGRGSNMKKSCACCKRYLEHLGGKMNCFLRRMTADSRHSMVLPNRFVNHFGGKISGTIKLESPNGIIYVVEVIKCTNKTVLQCGWEAFVDAHHIEENDSLLFRYIKKSCFEVRIFDSDDCENVFSCAGIRNTSSIQDNSADVDITSSSHDHTTGSSGSEGFARCQRGSFRRCRKTANLAATSSSSQQSGEDSPSEFESFESDSLQTPPEPDYVLSHKSLISEAQKEKVVMLIQDIQPEITVFVAIMRMCNVKLPAPFLTISKGYANVHFPSESSSVTLQMSGKRKRWQPAFYKRNDAFIYTLKGQWLDFVRDNRVMEGDICIFVPTKGGGRFTFTVHLLREAATHRIGGTGAPRIGSSRGRTNANIASEINIKEEPIDGEDVYADCNTNGVSHESLQRKDFGGPSKPPYFLPCKSRLSQPQKRIVEEKVQAIQSDVPIYVAIMTKSNVGEGGTGQCLLELGSRYAAAAHLPNGKRTVLLKRKGERWETMMQIRSGKRRHLVGGWRKFVQANRLRVGDICLFELKKNERKLTMAVHIIFSED